MYTLAPPPKYIHRLHITLVCIYTHRYIQDSYNCVVPPSPYTLNFIHTYTHTHAHTHTHTHTHTHMHTHTHTLQFLLTFHPGFAVFFFALSPSSTFYTSGQLLALVSTPYPPHYEYVHPRPHLPPAGEFPQSWQRA